MPWNGFPFCISGYGFCEKPEEEWPLWPLKFTLQLGSWKATLGLDMLFNTLASSFVGALTACFVVYIACRRHFNPKSDPNVLTSPQTTDHSAERPGALGDHDMEPPPPLSPLQKYPCGLSIMEMGCFAENWNPRKVELSPLRSRSRGSRKPSTLPTDVQTQSSQSQLLIEEVEKLEQQRDTWNPLLNYFVQFGGTQVEDELPTFTFEGEQKLVLHQFSRGKFHPCSVPYAMKLESMLRMCSIPYDIVFDCDKSGPWVSFADETIVGAQSCIKFIQKYFSNTKDYLSPIEKKVPALYIAILLDFHLYWGVAIWRCMIDEGKEMHLDQPISAIVLGAVERASKSLRMTSSCQSLKKMNGNDILDTIRDDLIALTASLGSKNHFIGDAMTDLDCSAFAILSQLLWSAPGHPFESLVRGYPSLVNYCLRIRRILWPDWDQLIGEKETSNIGAVLDNKDSVLDVGDCHSQESIKNAELDMYLDGKASKSATAVAHRVHGRGMPDSKPINDFKLEIGGDVISSIRTQHVWPVST